MDNNSNLSRLTLTLTLALFISGSVFAQTSGKLRGVVSDESTGEALIGANVIVDGTSLGSATDENGEYFILNVPPGTYTMRAEIIGYQTSVEADVRVFIDLTTTVNFVTSVQAVEGEAVEVLADRPLVQPDVAGTVVNASGEDFENIPVRSVNDFISQTAGVDQGM